MPARFVAVVPPGHPLYGVSGWASGRPLRMLALRWLPRLLARPVSRLRAPTGAEAEGWLLPWPRDDPADRPAWQAAVTVALRAGRRLGAAVVGFPGLPWGVGEPDVAGGLVLTRGTCLGIAAGLAAALRDVAARRDDPGRLQWAVWPADEPAAALAARMLAREVRYLVLVGRRPGEVDRLARRILQETGLAAERCDELGRVLHRCDVLVACGPPGGDGVRLKAGATICDLTPQRAWARAAAGRGDVHAVDGGWVRPPWADGHAAAPRPAWPADAAEAALLALVDAATRRRWAREAPSPARCDALVRLAERHGFRWLGPRGGDGAPTGPERAGR